MSLVNFEVQQPCITPSQLLLAMDEVIPSQTITNAIISTSSIEQRQRILPTHVVVVLVIAMSFWSSDSVVSVFKNLIHGFASLRIPELIRFKTPTSSSIIEYVVEENGTEKVYRLISDLMDIKTFPALLLATEYHQRWEAENTLDELKVHLNGRKTPIRSKNPREVVQEIYGWLLGHYCIRCLMFQSAEKLGLSPLHLSFTGSLRVVRRAIPLFQIAVEMFPDINVFFSWLISEIKDLKIPPPQHRSNPRVVNKTRSKFPSKKRCHRNNGTPRQLLSFQIFRKAS